MKGILCQAALLGLAVLCGLSCNSARVASERDLAAIPSTKPVRIYVTDFELGLQNLKHEPGALSGLPGAPGRVGTRLSGSASDPAARAQQVVDLMSSSLLKELSQAGFSAAYLPPGSSLPAEGWLVRGAFTEVQEGNRLRRAMIGFGQGQTDIQAITTVQDLSQGLPKPLYELATEAASGKSPGAAPTLVLGPYGAAARFVMAGKDLDKNVKQTAAKIAQQLSAALQPKDEH